jgi:uncharacterized protein (TIGR02145 family)
MKLKLYIVILFSSFILNKSHCQNVTNLVVDINQNIIKITYDLMYISEVELELSIDGDKFIKVNGTGDIGNYISSGIKKSIVFLPPKEVFVCSNCIFRVNAIRSDVFIDPRDGQWYGIFIDKNGYSWFGENLNYIDTGSIFIQNLDINTAKQYGRLYNWNSANRVCPSGWRLPSQVDWKNIIDEFGGVKIAGEKMLSPNGKFNAKLTGYKLDNTSSIHLIGIGYNASWWTSDYFNNENAISYNVNSSSSDILYNILSNKLSYRSVRCIKSSKW